MARGTWIVQTKVDSVWTNNTTIARPNDNFSAKKESTQTKTKLANGSFGYFSPSTKNIDQPITFIWKNDDGTIKTQVEGYIDNQTDLKIIDQNSVEYIGRFIDMDPIWIVGQDADQYDINATYEIMPGIE